MTAVGPNHGSIPQHFWWGYMKDTVHQSVRQSRQEISYRLDSEC